MAVPKHKELSSAESFHHGVLGPIELCLPLANYHDHVECAEFLCLSCRAKQIIARCESARAKQLRSTKIHSLLQAKVSGIANSVNGYR